LLNQIVLMGGIHMDEDEARSWLCAGLPQLRQAARTGGWSAALADALMVLDEGGTALDVIALLNLGPPRQVQYRGVGGFLPYGRYDTAVDGIYTCPDERCPRKAGRDQNGRPPQCELQAKPMRFTSP
jgi:hypothetical protein